MRWGPAGLEIDGALVELPAVPEDDAVDDLMATHSVSLLGRQVIILREGLDEVVLLPSVRFPESLLGERHLGEGGLSGAVPASHQPLSFPQRFSSYLVYCNPSLAPRPPPRFLTTAKVAILGHLPQELAELLTDLSVSLRQLVSVHHGDLSHVCQGGELVQVPSLSL